MKKLLLILGVILTLTLTACTGDDTPNEEIKYTIIFNTDEGSIIDSITVEENTTIQLPDAPTKEGYTFAGWYLENTFLNLASESYSVVEDATLYARWEDAFYAFRVTLHPTETTEAYYDFDYGDVTFLPRATKTGYTFEGWFYDEELTLPYDITATLTEDIDLYASYDPIETFVYLVFYGMLLDRFVIDYDEVVTPELFEVEGFDFVGYYTSTTFETEVTSITGGTVTQYFYADYDLATEDIDLTSLGYYDYLSTSNPTVTITVTDIGTMTLELFPEQAKNTVDNFIAYIQDGDYSGSTFHRTISNFMIQGGIVESTNCSIEGAFSANGITNPVSHTRGALSMARTSVMNSATSQFFIVHNNSDFLDGNYATFGGLVSGFNVMDFIALQYTDNADKPLTDIVIESMTVNLNGYVPGAVVCAN